MSLICISVLPTKLFGKFFIGIFTFTNSNQNGSICQAYKPLKRPIPVSPQNVFFINFRLFIVVCLKLLPTDRACGRWGILAPKLSLSTLFDFVLMFSYFHLPYLPQTHVGGRFFRCKLVVLVILGEWRNFPVPMF